MTRIGKSDFPDLVVTADRRARPTHGNAKAGCEQSQIEPQRSQPLPWNLPMSQKHQKPNDDVRQLKQATPTRFKLAASAGRIEGYGSVFGNVDSYGERVVRGAFAASIRTFKAEKRMPALLWQHRSDEPVGRWVDMHEDEIGLWMQGEFNLDTSSGKDAYHHVQARDVDGLSIGYETIKAQPNGKILDLLELRLMETSIVTFPANPRSRITGVKAESAADIEKILREGGLPRAFAAEVAKAGWAARPGQTSQPDPKLNELLAAVKAARLDLRKVLK